MGRVLFVLFVLAVAGVGFVIGWRGERWLDAVAQESATPRPDVLDAVWRARATGDADGLADALSRVDADAMPTPAYAAEVEVLRTMATGDREALQALADHHADVPAGAIALVALVDRAETAAEREHALALLRERNPTSWVLTTRRATGDDR